MKLICKLKGHDWKFISIVEGKAGFYQGDKQLIPLKQYKCLRCDKKISGVAILKKDHDVMMNYAKLGIAQQAWDISQVPNKIKELEEKIRKLENK